MQKKLNDKYKQEVKELQMFFNTSPLGKDILEQINKFCGYKENVFTSDVQQNAFNQGKQVVAIWLNKKLKENVE